MWFFDSRDKSHLSPANVTLITARTGTGVISSPFYTLMAVIERMDRGDWREHSHHKHQQKRGPNDYVQLKVKT